MEVQIKTLSPKKLVGTHLRMSLAHNKTYALWHSFMPRLKEFTNRAGNDLLSMQVYDEDFDFKDFNMSTEFDKWAVTEVVDFDSLPQGMDTFVLPGGLYAVFLHKGPASTGPITFQYIFGTWLPHSGYELDQRPHFELLGAKYKNEDPDSEEEIWIPIKPRVA